MSIFRRNHIIGVIIVLGVIIIGGVIIIEELYSLMHQSGKRTNESSPPLGEALLSSDMYKWREKWL